MTDSAYENVGLLRWKVSNNTTRLDRIEDWRRTIDSESATVKERLRALERAVREVDDDLKSLRRMIFAGFASTTSAFLIFALTVLAGTGKI